MLASPIPLAPSYSPTPSHCILHNKKTLHIQLFHNESNLGVTLSQTDVASFDVPLAKEVADRLNIILMIPHGRAGSFFVQSLFDGHEAVIMFPANFRSYDWEQSNLTNPDQLINDFITQNQHLFDSRDSYLGDVDRKGKVVSLLGDKGDTHIQIDIATFKTVLKVLLQDETEMSRKRFFLFAHVALAHTLGKNICHLKYVFVHFHSKNTNSLLNLLSDFPNLHLLALVRDPRENWASYREVVKQIEDRTSLPDISNRFIHHLKDHIQDFGQLLQLSHKLPAEHIKVIDLNRLHIVQEEGMKNLAQWLDIDFTSTLTQSTFLGQTWWGNAHDRKPLSGFSYERSQFKWPNRLSQSEIAIVEYLSYNIISALQYEAPTHQPSRLYILKKIYFTLPDFPIFCPEVLTKVFHDSRTKRFERAQTRFLNYIPKWLIVLPVFLLKTTSLMYKHRAFLARYSYKELKEVETINASYCHAQFQTSNFLNIETHRPK